MSLKQSLWHRTDREQSLLETCYMYMEWHILLTGICMKAKELKCAISVQLVVNLVMRSRNSQRSHVENILGLKIRYGGQQFYRTFKRWQQLATLVALRCRNNMSVTKEVLEFVTRI